jgi:spore coat protein A
MKMDKLRRRQFLKIGAAGGASFLLPWGGVMPKAWAAKLAAGLLDPAKQPLFAETVPNALDPGFKYQPIGDDQYMVGMHKFVHELGLVDPKTKGVLSTEMYGYGQDGNPTYPGKTFEVQSGKRVSVRWTNNLPLGQEHLLPVDTSLHWCYSLKGYENFNIKDNGVPVIPHVHGGHNESASDGLPEYFFTPDWQITGPRFVKKDLRYDNDQEAGTIWYHDHALGITRLNVYAGLAGFFIIRDDRDTGKPDNPLGLPAFPYEAAFAIQDKMFNEDGSLFYPAFPGDPAYKDFISGEGAVLPEDLFPGGGPTALAEFFGDHIIVNGKIWPKMGVEPRHYRVRLLNGCDSRFLVCQLKAVDAKKDDPKNGTPVSFYQIGTDDGLLGTPVPIDEYVVIGPGERVDLVIDFSDPSLAGKRVILENIGPDAPFGGDIPASPTDLYPNRRTNRIMAFDVNQPFDENVPDNFNPNAHLRPGGAPFTVAGTAVTTRKLALFEGKDEFGRLQPLLGVVDPSLPDQDGTQPINQPTDGALGWFQGITENPGVNDVEVWEIYNVTEDAHPIHLHLVAFEILNRQDLGVEGVDWEIIERPQPQHNSIPGNVAGAGEFPAGQGFYGIAGALKLLQGDGTGGNPIIPPLPNERGPNDTAQMYPGQVTRIKMKFDKPGRYVWHCHILSHEDHEMMRPYHVGGFMNPYALQVDTPPVKADNYPNPFTHQTQFRIELPTDAQVELRIFDGAGRHIRTLGKGTYAAGEHTISWNGTNKLGMAIPTGMYFYQVLANREIAATGKVIKH